MEKRIKIEKADDNGDIDELFNQYLEICNKAIDKHKDEFPYKQILSATNAVVGDKPIDLTIYDDEPKGAFSLKFKDKKLVHNGTPEDVKKAWRVNLSYVKNVLEHPDKYIEHPEKLDMDWLKSRFGF
ncbi:hypothetical protein N9W34_00150 [Rickettsiales bacterium]|nr:hypothetical protein [Rickettsiales bacterium]